MIRLCTHNHTTYLVCTHGNLLQPHLPPREQGLEIQSVHNPRNLVNHTQVLSPENQCQCALMHVWP
jgi:hypothetical protein